MGTKPKAANMKGPDMFCSSSAQITIPDEILDVYRGRSILVTGGRGYIGSALTQALAHVDCKLLLVDQSPARTWSPEPKRAEVSLLSGDVSDIVTWERALPGVDYVFHLAAREDFYRAGYHPESDLRSNALSTLHLLEVCRTQGYKPRIVFASSANLYGLVDTLPVTEECRDNPLTVYAIHKLTAEHYLSLYRQNFGIDSTSLRLANVYGPSARRAVMNRVIINKVISQALSNNPLTNYANHTCIRDYVFLNDVIQAFLLAAPCCNTNERPAYVIGSGHGETFAGAWQLIADRVQACTGKNIPIQLNESINMEPLEFRNFVADTTLFQAATGLKPNTALAQGIDLTINAYISEPMPIPA